MKVKAMVVTEPGHLELQTFEIQKTPSDHILVKTTATSVCSSDIKVFKGYLPMVRYPLIMGHEISGEVVEVGSEAARWHDLKPGERVTVEPYVPCGHCEDSRISGTTRQTRVNSLYTEIATPRFAWLAMTLRDHFFTGILTLPF